METIIKRGDVSKTMGVKSYKDFESYLKSRIKQSDNSIWEQCLNAFIYYQRETMPNIPDEDEGETKGFAKRFPTVKERVKSIVKNGEYARKSYLYLCLRYWVKCGQIKIIIPMSEFGKSSSPETITRALRDLVSDAKKGDPKLKFLLTDKKTLERRELREKELRDYFSSDNKTFK